MCQLKVKVTVKCQILNKQVLDFMSCPLCKPYTNGRISLDVQSPCCPCVSSRSRSQIIIWRTGNMCVPYELVSGVDFTKV